jgi:plasmid replication initiation protein
MQLPFVELDSPLLGPVTSEHRISALPFFALSKQPHMTNMVYTDGRTSIEIRPSTNGIATIYDKEILIYIMSLMAEQMEEHGELSRTFKFTAHDFFRVVGTNASARSYERLQAAIERLQGTQIKTNIRTGKQGQEGFFSWISEANTVYDERDDRKRLKAISVTVCEWLARAVMRDRTTLIYHRDYFGLGPLERRMYEVAHSYCEKEPSYTLPLEELGKRVGQSAEFSIRHLRSKLRKMEISQPLPDYKIFVVDCGRDAESKFKQTDIRFMRRDVQAIACQ